MNRKVITAGGHVVVRRDGDEIVVAIADGVDDRHLHFDEKGKVTDQDGATVAFVTPPPNDDTAALVFAALLREAVWVPALPPKAVRVSATATQVIGAGNDAPKAATSPCACSNGTH